jgi:hypothetical protein
LIPLHAVDKPAITSTRLSLAYKSRRRRLNRRGKKRRGNETVRGEKEENRGGRGQKEKSKKKHKKRIRERVGA